MLWVPGAREAITHPTTEAEAHGWRELWRTAVLTVDHRGRYGQGESVWLQDIGDT
jgi:hypothetical protein